MNFKDYGFREEIIKAVEDLGFETPTPIQENAYPVLLKETSDLVGLAQTGTGKTAAFGLPLIEMTDFDQNFVQALVIAPTRELCIQISNDLKNFSKYIKNAKIATIYGGASIDKQAREVRSGAQIVVATPGRLIDMLNRGLVKLGRVQIVVLDEADEMLNMGFKEDIDTILETTPDTKRVWLFSATMPPEVEKIARNYMHNPKEISVGQKNKASENVRHVYYVVRDKDRYYALKRILDYHPNIYGLIFCKTKRETQQIADRLLQDGYNAEPLHGDLSQAQRDSVMKKFREKTLQILVATDVAARGIDINDITHVINYKIPEDIENYTHRSGRTGRAGKTGEAISIITPLELKKIKAIEKVAKVNFEYEKVPSGKEICRRQLYALVEKIKNIDVKEDDIAEYMTVINNMFEGIDREELIKKFISAEVNHLLEYYDRAYDLNARITGKDLKIAEREATGKMQRIFVSIGERAGLNKGALLRLVCNSADINSKKIGRIDLFNDFSFFEVEKDYTDQVLEALKNAEFEGTPFKAEIASAKKSKGRSRSRNSSNNRNSRNNYRKPEYRTRKY